MTDLQGVLEGGFNGSRTHCSSYSPYTLFLSHIFLLFGDCSRNTALSLFPVSSQFYISDGNAIIQKSFVLDP
jgi:hypothetical protein